MSQQANIALHKALIVRARQLPVGSIRRMELINRSIHGIIRAMVANYNPQHA